MSRKSKEQSVVELTQTLIRQESYSGNEKAFPMRSSLTSKKTATMKSLSIGTATPSVASRAIVQARRFFSTGTWTPFLSATNPTGVTRLLEERSMAERSTVAVHPI